MSSQYMGHSSGGNFSCCMHGGLCTWSRDPKCITGLMLNDSHSNIINYRKCPICQLEYHHTMWNSTHISMCYCNEPGAELRESMHRQRWVWSSASVMPRMSLYTSAAVWGTACRICVRTTYRLDTQDIKWIEISMCCIVLRQVGNT